MVPKDTLFPVRSRWTFPQPTAQAGNDLYCISRSGRKKPLGRGLVFTLGGKYDTKKEPA